MENHITAILEKVVKNSGLEQDKFGESIGLKKAAFNNYIKGRREIPKSVITSLMEIHNVNPQVFFDPNAPLYIHNSMGCENRGLVELESAEFPLFGSVAAGALAVVEGVTTDNVEYASLPKKFLGRYENCKDLFAMIVNGESMNKVIANGSIVIAKPLEINQYKAGDIVIFSYNNEYSLKRFAPNDVEGFLLFKSESTDSSFKDIAVPISTIGELKIYGKIIYYGTTL